MLQKHYRTTAKTLAKWLTRQGDECWWYVDGDPLLTGLVSFPCKSSVLAKALVSLDKCLLVPRKSSDPDKSSNSSSIFNVVAQKTYLINRVLILYWEDKTKPHGHSSCWFLSEDKETAKEYNKVINSDRLRRAKAKSK